MNTITFEGEENIKALAAVFILGIGCLIEAKKGGDSIQVKFSEEILSQVEKFKDQLLPITETSEDANKFFLRKAMQSLTDEIDNPPPPKKSRWQERLEEVQAAQKEAQERREKSSNIQKKYKFEP